MKKNLGSLLLSVFLLTSISASAQKMITFESRPQKAKDKHRTGDGKNSLTMGFASFFNGYTPVYYERTITSFLTLSAGAGVTHRGYMGDLGLLLWDEGATSEFFNGSDDIPDNYSSYKFRVCKPGAYLSFSPKFYVFDNALDGAFCGPMIEYKNFLYNVQVADIRQQPTGSYSWSDDDQDIPRAGNTLSESMTCLDLTMNSGGHFQLKNHLAIGWNFGIGVRRRSSDRLDLGVQYDADNNPYYVNNVRTYSTSKPLFTFNFTLGGWF